MPDKEKSNLAQVAAAINKTYKENVMVKLGEDVQILDRQYMPTGSYGLDLALGGGLIRGKVVEIYGPPSSGKSTLTMHMMAQAQKYGSVLLVDMECSADPVYAAKIGVDVDNLYISQPSYSEMAFEIIEGAVASGEVSLVVLDSVAALPSRAEVEGESGDSNMGISARLLTQHIRKLTPLLNKTKTTAIYVNQVRKFFKAAAFGPQEYTPGASLLTFLSSIRLDMRRIKTIGDEDKTGIITKIKSTKNKTFLPFREAEVLIEFGTGINTYQEVLGLAEKAGIVQKSGAWYNYGDVKLGQGEQNAANYIKESNLLDKLVLEIKERANIK